MKSTLKKPKRSRKCWRKWLKKKAMPSDYFTCGGSKNSSTTIGSINELPLWLLQKWSRFLERGRSLKELGEAEKKNLTNLLQKNLRNDRVTQGFTRRRERNRNRLFASRTGTNISKSPEELNLTASVQDHRNRNKGRNRFRISKGKNDLATMKNFRKKSGKNRKEEICLAMTKPCNKKKYANLSKDFTETKNSQIAKISHSSKKTAFRNIQTAEPNRVRNAWIMHNKQKVLMQQEREEREQKIAKNMKKLQQQYCKIKKERLLKYIVCFGNNSELVRRVMETRHASWSEIPDNSKIYNFKWKPFSYGIRFEEISLYGHQQVVNHIFNHEEITMKDKLFHNISEYCKEHKMDVFKYVPPTFILDFNSKGFINDLCYLEKLFEVFRTEEANSEEFQLSTTEKPPPYSQDSLDNFPSDLEHHKSHIGEGNLWFLKLTKLNRGRGIYVFDSMDQLISLINECTESVEGHSIVKIYGKTSKSKKNYAKVPTLSTNLCMKDTLSQRDSVKYRSSIFVIQKYIERPLLIQGRKFDIRIWALYWNKRVHIFEEGYIRTACEPFSNQNTDVSNQYIHLTNNAIQKFAKNYGTYEEGNQLSFGQFQEHMEAQDPCFKIHPILKQIEDSVVMTFRSIEHTFMQRPKNHDKSCFEIFGYDFMIDEHLKVWLIECNTNPCIEESSKLLQRIIPRMIDDALNLVLDETFSTQEPNLKDRYDKPRVSQFPIPGYEDTCNLWKSVLTLSI
ncbi:unnamed protein product [Moneuplotes crassus]|uniref:Uncharacterized protein n=1 Tax=Euplotes crassus TaxID=5936 RepID=A0AAD1UGU3_EUPCR|nr:unnamed protein product [Moneuplotes crassus]